MVVRKMKEKCKDAARMRREKERAEFVELSKLLPLPSSTTSQLDKASIIRLTSSYLKMRAAFPHGLGENWGHKNLHKLLHLSNNDGLQQYSNTIEENRLLKQQMNQVKELGSLLLQTLDGFVFALHKDGKIMYISETASVHLGLPQIDLTGSSIFEYVHPSDHNDIYAILGLNEIDRLELMNETQEALAHNNDEQTKHYELNRSFCMRMKCILPKRNAGLVSSGYKAIHCNGYLKVRRSFKSSLDNQQIGQSQQKQLQQQQQHEEWESYALVAVGHSLLPTASTEVKLTGNSFMFRANLDLKIHYIEAFVVKLLGFEQIELMGQSLYQFVHVNDTQALESSHRSLLDKGQVVTKYYRLMKRDGGCVWIQSYATIVNNLRNMPKPNHIVSICFVLAENPSDQSGIVPQSQEQVSQRIRSDYSLPTSTSTSNTSSSSSSLSSSSSTISSIDNSNNNGAEGGQKSKTTVNKSISNSSGYESSTSQHTGGETSGNLRLQLRSQRRDRSSNCGQRKLRKLRTQHVPTHKEVSSINSNNNSNNNFPLFGNQNTADDDQLLSSSLVNNKSTIDKNNCAGCQRFSCTCTCTPHQINCLPSQNPIIVGPLRRPSDDTCSIVSSVASTSLSSNASSHLSGNDFLGGYNTGNSIDPLSYQASVNLDHSSRILPSQPSYLFDQTVPPSINKDLVEVSSLARNTSNSYDEFNINHQKIVNKIYGEIDLSTDGYGRTIVWPSSFTSLQNNSTTAADSISTLPSSAVPQVVAHSQQLVADSELQVQFNQQQNCNNNISQSSVYFTQSTSSPDHWFAHDNHCLNQTHHQLFSNQQPTTGFICQCSNESILTNNTYNSDTSTGSQYHESSPYLSNNSTIHYHQHHHHQVSNNNRYTMTNNAV